MAGLQGAGKTTTTASSASGSRSARRRKCWLVSCDVYRPAAIEQLKTVAAQAGIDFFPSEAGQKPAEIAAAALDYAAPLPRRADRRYGGSSRHR
jgi:signal recognition particle subunit SRP54